MKLSIKKSFGLTALSFFALSACNEVEHSTMKQETVAVIEKVSTTKPHIKAKDLAPYLERHIQDEVFYFVLPDRFNNGDTDNDNGSKTIKISSGGFDKSYNGAYHGGDIKGLENKLPYLEDLGITAIWLTPILRNQAVQGKDSGYHGYWVLDFTEIDPHLGSNDDLKSFIDAAHKKNIKVFFDIIANHTADVIKYPKCHGEDGAGWSEGGQDCPYKSLAQVAAGDKYQTMVPKGMENIKTPAWLNGMQYYHNQGDTTYQGENSIYGDFAGLDDINTDDPVVVKKMIDIFTNLIDVFQPDGFRIDTVKHVNTEFWSEFAPALVDHANAQGIEQFFMFGEVYSADSKVLSEYTTTGKIQSILDFGFQKALELSLIDQQGTDVFTELFANDKDYLTTDLTKNQSADQLMTFTGNHDMGRFAGMIKQSKHGYDEQQQIQRTLLAHAIMYFSRGIPVIYYGDEQGFVGSGGDRYARQDMLPSEVVGYNNENLLATDKTTADANFDTQHLFYQKFADYADIYQRYPALRYGVQTTLYSQNTPGIYAFSRDYNLTDNDKDKRQKLIIAINTATDEQQFSFTGNTASSKLINISGDSDNKLVSYNGENNLMIEVPALSFSIYQEQ